MVASYWRAVSCQYLRAVSLYQHLRAVSSCQHLRSVNSYQYLRAVISFQHLRAVKDDSACAYMQNFGRVSLLVIGCDALPPLFIYFGATRMCIATSSTTTTR